MEKFPTPPKYLSYQQTRLIAARQILSFLFVPGHLDEEKSDPVDELFSVDGLPDSAFTEGPELFAWKDRTIYDVDGLQLFHDHTIDIDSENEIEVRVAASDWLGAPVWSVSAGRQYVDQLAYKTFEFISSRSDLEPEIVDGKKDAIVCYSYPKLGILCRFGKELKEKVVVDISDREIFPVDQVGEPKYPFVKAVWSPYEMSTRGTIANQRWLWARKIESLPEENPNRHCLRQQILMARQAGITRTTTPTLDPVVGQQNYYYCAPATFRMILRQIWDTVPQGDIADEMNTTPENGTSLSEQENSIVDITAGEMFGDLDNNETFTKAVEEIDDNRSFKSGTVTDHARACGGYKLENGKQWLIIYDPWPSTQGRVKTEEWDAIKQKNFVYVRPA
jgi:hypothetical protein